MIPKWFKFVEKYECKSRIKKRERRWSRSSSRKLKENDRRYCQEKWEKTIYLLKIKKNEWHHYQWKWKKKTIVIVIVRKPRENDFIAREIEMPKLMLLSRKMSEMIDSFLDNNYCSYNYRLWEYATTNEFMSNNCQHISLPKKRKS